MEFRETLLAAQRNQQQKSSENLYYKARFDPPKKEHKSKDKLSANIQKFLAKKEEEEKQKKLEAQRKREELSAMRDPKALRKIQKTLKVIKSANKSVLEDAVDRDNTAVTREGPDQPGQDDYGYESQEAAAFYVKMMQKYSKIPDEPKFPSSNTTVKKDLNGTRERVKHALQHEDDPVPHKRKRKSDGTEKEPSSPPSKYEPEKKRDEKDKHEKPKIRKAMPPPMDFNQLLKLAEQKKSEPLDVAAKKALGESEPERLMTKKQRKEYEEEMARRQRRQERIDAEKGGNRRIQKDDRPAERERKPEPSGFGRIPKLGDKASGSQISGSPKPYDNKDRDKNDRDRTSGRQRNESPQSYDNKDRDRDRIDKMQREREKALLEKERALLEKERALLEKEKAEREKERLDRERLERLKAERDRIDREMERLNKGDKLDKPKPKLDSKMTEKSRLVDRSKLNSKEPVRQEVKKSIDLKSQNTYRIEKSSDDRRLPVSNKNDSKYPNGLSSQGKPVPKSIKDGMKDRVAQAKQKSSFDDRSPKLNGQMKTENGKRLPETKGVPAKRQDDRRPPQAGPSKQTSNSFDFDKHVNSLGKNGGRQFPPGEVKRKPQPDDKRKPKRRLDSDSEYDSEMDDFIDDRDENMDYSKHIKEIFGYDKSKYRYMDDDDDPHMESSFVQQQREEYISKKQGIMEDLEDMRMEAMEKKKSKKKRRISDD